MDDITLLDGGMGRELEQMGAPFRQPEWSALSLMETPDIVRKAHDNFINSGAQVITTNCYAIIPFHIGQERYDAQGRELIALSAKIAREAVDASDDKRVKVAGCIPPLFGSYCPDQFDETVAPAMLAAFIEEQMPFVDVWLAETLSSKQEARMICEALITAGSPPPLWLSYSLSQDEPLHLRSGEALGDIVQFTCDETPAQALLYNCCAIEDIEDALIYTREVLPEESDLMIGAYPNAFQRLSESLQANETLNPMRCEVTPEFFAEYAAHWVKAGADIIGGCCGISPAHISALKSHL